MSDTTTIARPYAKAIFEMALAANLLPEWSAVLTTLAQTVSNPDTLQFIRNPSVTAEQQGQLLLSVLAARKPNVDEKFIAGFVMLLAKNKRLLSLPGIATQYALFRAEQEKTMIVNVHSFSPLSDGQQKRLIETLTKRLKREISLDMSIEPSLLGGALIQAGDLVMDGSIRGQLLKLKNILAA